MRTFLMAVRAAPNARRVAATLFAALFGITGHTAFATGSAAAQRFQLSGSGTLSLDAPVQKTDRLQLKATLTPQGAALAASPPVQENARFAVMATLAAASLVCYNDTIFRDDFDGDGG